MKKHVAFFTPPNSAESHLEVVGRLGKSLRAWVAELPTHDDKAKEKQ